MPQNTQRQTRRGAREETCVSYGMTNPVINGAPISTINQATLLNPEVLEEYIGIGAELRADLAAKGAAGSAGSHHPSATAAVETSKPSAP